MVSQMLPVEGVKKKENTEIAHARTHRGHQKAFKN